MPVNPGDVFSYSEPRALVALEGYRRSNNYREYDVAPDDSRFIMIRLRRGGGVGELVVVENLLEELRAR